MGFWFYMLCCNLLFPAIMLIGGRMFLKQPPKHINRIVGYRTARSMRNEDTWRFAHTVAGKYWWKWGFVSLPVAVLPMLFLIGRSEDAVGFGGLIIMCLLMIPVIGVIPHTETALKQTFDKDGHRKTGTG